MSDIYIQGETLQVGKKFDSALIEGLNETFETIKPKIITATGSGPAPGGETGIQSKVIDDEPIKSKCIIGSYIESVEVS